FLIDFSDSLDPQVYSAIEAWVEDAFGMLYNWLSGMDYSAIGTGVSNFATGVVRLFFGFIISVYFLFSKDDLICGIKKLLFAVFGKEKAVRIVETGRKTNEIFLNFIVSRLLQSLIIFILGLIVLVPLRIPLAPLVALVIGVTNMIPYLGPWLGGAVCVLLVLFYSPVKALWVLLYILGVQILDNAIIGPKVMSDQVGISPLLVILGVTLGATFGGVFGMFIGVPVVAVLKLVFYDPYISRKLGGENIDF
ncbi:MAG: AI-2E family transporter, partial [Clostridia bacterium]|nr:AI-2E family transporter [Clostridia bacterium]